MRRLVRSVVSCLLLSVTTYALPTQYAFRISFTNKVGTASISTPLSFLSQRALDRRAKYNIAVDSTDLPVSPAYLDSVATITSGIIHVTSKWLNDCVVLVDDTSTIQTLRTKPFVSKAEWVGFFASGLHDKPIAATANAASLFSSPTIKKNAKPTGNASYYGSTWDQTHLVNGDCLHDGGNMGQGILIALFDNGFSWINSGPAFDSLYHSGRLIDSFNFVKDTNFILGYGSHGTEVLSVLAGYLPNYYVGAAPLAQYALYITEDATSEQPIELDNLIAGFERADSLGADLMSMSLGYNIFDAPFPAITSAQLDGKSVNASKAANLAMQKGIMMIVSAGNEGSGGLLAPGDADSVLTIGNVNNNKIPATSSGHGPNASGTIKPNVCGLGNPGYVMTSSMTVTPESGTSISTPSIAGFTACLMQANPTKNPFQIRNTIQQTGNSFANPGVQLGYGVPDFCAAAAIFLDVNEPEINHKIACIVSNPIDETINLQLSLKKNQSVQFTLVAMNGRTIQKETAAFKTGTSFYQLKIPNTIAAGIYLLKINGEDFTTTQKLIKQ